MAIVIINSMTYASNGPGVCGLRTVFLDRDGVVNEKLPEGRYVRSWNEFHLLSGVPEGIARLNRAGLRVLVVSNQRGISLGLYSDSDVLAIHSKLLRELKNYSAHIDGFYYCPHDENMCDCRKPSPGLFKQAVAEFPNITSQDSVMIGDSVSDMEFARRLGMGALFIEGDSKRQKPGLEKARELAGRCYGSLLDAVDYLLGENA